MRMAEDSIRLTLCSAVHRITDDDGFIKINKDFDLLSFEAMTLWSP